MERYKILVTGACGVTSRSVVRSLNMSSIFANKCEFIGTDVCYNTYGIYEGLYSKVYKVPYTTSSEYIPIMQKIIQENNIEYAIVIPELEVLFWSQHPFDVKYLAIPPIFARTVLSKKTLYETLQETSLIPRFQIIKREDILGGKHLIKLSYPLWIRDYSEGSTSGKGAFMAEDYSQLCAWVIINKNIESFMLSEYLSGRNLCCFTLYKNGRLLKYGVGQRIEYLMSKVAVSGITGNISRGKLVNDQSAVDVTISAINSIIAKTEEIMNGLVVADLKENAAATPKITEINIRHIATTSSFASAGLNFSEMQLLCLMNRESEISSNLTIEFPPQNAMLRDVDGLPIYVPNYRDLENGEYY